MGGAYALKAQHALVTGSSRGIGVASMTEKGRNKGLD
jgi:short-subunit dehydrogenase